MPHLFRTALLWGQSNWLPGLFFAALLCGCGPQQTEPAAEVIVLHTGRLRGNVYPLELQAIAPLQHYQYIAGYVAAVRKEAQETGARVVLVDLGDSLGGTFASHVTGSRNVAKFFNQVGYDAIQLGNLDNQVSPEVLQEIEAVIVNPFVGPDGRPAAPGTGSAAEIVPATNGQPPVYLLANYYGDTRSSEYPDRFPNSFGKLSSGVEAVRDYSAVLDSVGPLPEEALVLFGWAKFEAPESPPQDFLQLLREWGVDAILAQRVYGSKERDVWSENRFVGWTPPVSQNILRNNGGFTIARMDLKREGGRWVVLRQQLIPMTANTAAADPAIIATESAFAPSILEADRAVGELEHPLGEEQILRLFLKALTTLGNPGAVAYSPQSIRSEWAAGPLRASAVFNSLPWTSPFISMRLRAEEIEGLQESNPGLTFWVRDGESGDKGPVELVTSAYFANIFARQLGKTAEELTILDPPSEFDYFLGFLETEPDALDPAMPAGWSAPGAPATTP